MHHMARSARSGVAQQGTGGLGRPGLLVLAVLALVLGGVLAIGGSPALVQRWNLLPLAGLSIALTMGHFVVDAGIWRLRDSFVRSYVGAAFPFLGPGGRSQPAAGVDPQPR